MIMRKLDRIEKELGYCEVKIEKERRLRKQAVYLHVEIEAIDEVLDTCRAGGVENWFHSQSLDRFSFEEIPRKLRGQEKDAEQQIKHAFSMLGTYVVLTEERSVLVNELDDIKQTLASLEGFSSQHVELEEQRRKILKSMGLGTMTVKGRRFGLVEEFDKFEKTWNFLNEDLANLEDTVLYLERNLDYLGSCREYILAASNDFDVRNWLDKYSFSDVVRHSAVGRSFEMVSGADLNLKLAEKEILCLDCSLPTRRRSYKMIGPFVHALFEDLFYFFNFHKTREVVENVIKKNRIRFEILKEFNEKIESKKYDMDAERDEKYMEMEEQVKRLVYK